ncbi:hypothetical protein LKM2_1645 [Leptospira kirschneri serovar Mozdok]|nr:hypothetical protein [Leptospira kirschneri serovar Mozdok]
MIDLSSKFLSKLSPSSLACLGKEKFLIEYSILGPASKRGAFLISDQTFKKLSRFKIPSFPAGFKENLIEDSFHSLLKKGMEIGINPNRISVKAKAIFL